MNRNNNYITEIMDSNDYLSINFILTPTNSAGKGVSIYKESVSVL